MTGDSSTPTTPAVEDVCAALFAQLMDVMGLEHPSVISRLVYPILYLPIRRLSSWFVELDRNVATLGWNMAVKRFLAHLASRLELSGVDHIPRRGPVMVVCNHPAALDVVILAAAIPRDDLMILASDIPFVQLFPHIAMHSIPVYYDIPRRLHTVRQAMRHLRGGGAILIFPRGNVEPDPAVSPGAVESLAGWSASIELFLRRAPQTQTVVAAAWGMLSAGWYKLPLLNLWKKYEQRQKVAEIFQIATQLVTGRTPSATPSIRFSSPLSVGDLGGEAAPEGAYLEKITGRAREMLREPGAR